MKTTVADTSKTTTLNQILHGMAEKFAVQNEMSPDSYRRFCVDQELKALTETVEAFAVVLGERLAVMPGLTHDDCVPFLRMCSALERKAQKTAAAIASHLAD